MKPFSEALAHLRLVWDRRLGHPTADQLRRAMDSKPSRPRAAAQHQPLSLRTSREESLSWIVKINATVKTASEKRPADSRPEQKKNAE